MKHPSLEITIQSANNLSKVGFPSKMKPYVIVSIADPASSLQQQTTPIDKTGKENPGWNFPLKFTLNEASLQINNNIVLHLQVFSRRKILPDILIGQVHLRGLDLLSNVKESSSCQITSKRSGQPRGVVNFSFKVEGIIPDYIPQQPKQQVQRQVDGGRSNNGTGLLDAASTGLVVGDLVSAGGGRRRCHNKSNQAGGYFHTGHFWF